MNKNSLKILLPLVTHFVQILKIQPVFFSHGDKFSKKEKKMRNS